MPPNEHDGEWAGALERRSADLGDGQVSSLPKGYAATCVCASLVAWSLQAAFLSLVPTQDCEGDVPVVQPLARLSSRRCVVRTPAAEFDHVHEDVKPCWRLW